jgi:hypothetical protein
MSVNIFELDDVDIVIPVLDGATGQPKNLTGATVLAIISDENGEKFDGNAAVVDAQSGLIEMSFQPATFRPVTYQFQVRVTDNQNKTRTVVTDSITARRSFRLIGPILSRNAEFWGNELIAASQVYTTVTAGMNATSDQNYFFVKTQNGTKLEMWRNVDGLATPVSLV